MFHFVQNLEKSSTIDSTYALLRTFDLILTKYLQATLYVWCKQLVIPINKHNQKKLKSCTTINFTKPLKQHTTILHQLTMFHHYGQRKDTWNCHFLAQHKREHTWTRNEWEVWTICSTKFHEAYWTQNLVQEEIILTKNEYE